LGTRLTRSAGTISPRIEADSQEFSRQVTTEEGQAFADRMGTLFVECSAKTNLGVGDIFDDLVRKVCTSFGIYSMLTDRYWKIQNYGLGVLRRTRSSKSQKMKMIVKDGAGASGNVIRCM